MKTLLAAALAALPLVANAQSLLIHNARGLTLDERGQVQRFEAMAVDAEGRIQAIGRLADLSARASTDIRRIDAKGQVLMPGLIDAHGHVLDLGLARRSLDLRNTADLPAALAAVKDYAAARPDAPWLLGGAWNQALWKLGRFPTAAELDSAESTRPAWLERIDGHAGWANSRALQIAGITRDTPDPQGGRIERDGNGDATGVLVDNAMDLVARHVPAPTAEEARLAFEAAQQELLSLGLTSVQWAGVANAGDAFLRVAASNGQLKIRIDGMASGSDAGLITRLLKDGPFKPDAQGMYSLRAVKLFADGALGSRGAALLTPYRDAPQHKGLLFQSDAALLGAMRPLVKAGFQINVHAIGDAGNRQVLAAFETLQREFGKKSTALRHRIEHAQVIALADLPRFKRAEVIASVQPTHATSDMNMAEDRVGHERIQGAYAWQRLRAAGARLACGSDFPVEEPTPWAGLYAAVSRQDAVGKPPAGWYAGQALTRVQALACFTRDAAYAAHRESELGALLPGMRADFILVDRDPLASSAQGLLKTKVLQTWVGGKLVFEAR